MRNICIYCCILKLDPVKWVLLPKVVIPLVKFFLHPFVALVDEDGRHMSHPSLVAILLIKMDQVLKINGYQLFIYILKTHLKCNKTLDNKSTELSRKTKHTSNSASAKAVGPDGLKWT